MATAHEIAAEILHSLGPNVVARFPPMTYGEYAHAIGRDPAKYGLAVGKAMHAIGALCVIRQVPVAPLFWVRRADDGYRGIFESDALERQYIVASNDIDAMYVVSREHHYTTEEFAGIEAALTKSLASGNLSKWSPHKIWHLTFNSYPKDCPLTYYQRAMNHYRELLTQMKVRKLVSK